MPMRQGHGCTQDDNVVSQVVVCSACSGHGYKFCSVIGEIMADLSVEGSTRHDIGLFRLDRFD